MPRVDGTPDSVVVVLAPTDDDHPQELGWIDTNTGAVLHRIEAGRAQATMKCIEPGGVALLRPTEGDRWHSIEVYDSVRRERVFRRQGMGTPKDIEPGEGCFSIRVGSKTENWRLPDGEPVVRCANAPEVWEFNTRFALPFSRNHVARTAKLLVEVDGDLRRLELRARRGNSPAWKADLELRSPGWAETSRGHVVTAAPDIVVTYGFELATETDPRAVLIGVDPARGEVVWRASVGNAGKHAQRLLDTGGPIVLAFEGGLLAVDRTDGAEIWRLPPG